eukprot:CAMPEP_0118891172 /NCGR_PEP_ID=MMETSP1166-20130328/1303_1 /TAXON_ID=1104430 /ORGANISM="Chrysoreinhardia sp, Strain CCMP3193" /LENGTH=67 /DNA_ID=CAMNT_0006829815 /DNA_START=14 /DNA_END=215 /DNA_ORIENTATION=-
MAADDVSTWRGDTRRITRGTFLYRRDREDLEAVANRESVAAVVSETNDAADKEKLALAKEQLALAEK